MNASMKRPPATLSPLTSKETIMTMKAPKTATEKDALIATAAQHGLTVTRTSTDFYLHDGDDKTRLTPGQILVMSEEARFEARAKAAAFEAAEALRAEVEMGEGDSLEDQLDQALGNSTPSTPVDMPAPAPVKPVIKYGPPCGGKIDHLKVVTLPESSNPLMHLDFLPQTIHDNKEQARDHGRATCQGQGYLTFMAVHGDKRFWVAAGVDADGTLTLDGHRFTLELLTGQAAADARARLQGTRWQQKHQFKAIAA